MEDCIKELQRPGLDPREELEQPCFKSDVLDIKDVQV
jgi:transcriptional accessory protein Tex/SPT6